MGGRKLRSKLAAAFAASMLALVCAAVASPQSDPGPMLRLYVDPATKVVYTEPGKGRRLLAEIPASALAAGGLKRQQDEMRAEFKRQQEDLKAQYDQQASQQQQWNAEMAKQVSDMQPAYREFGDKWMKKISINTLVYGDYGFFSHTGFGPQFLTQQNWPGPGNNSFNSFNITRAYLDFKFTPTDDFLMRVTPNVYATIGTPPGDKIGNNTGYGQTLDGNLGYRLKYAYLDYNTFFKKLLPVDAMAEDKFTFGQQQNPLVDWEENLWGFRYTALTPWNYLSLSSTQVGLSMKGPIKFRETQYADYDFGVYDDASFHAIEVSAYKQVMGRLTINPLGAKSRYDSLGLTAFYDYGYPNKAPDIQTGPHNAAADASMTRLAALMHYTAETWGLIFEFDYGRNAFAQGNLYSGSGPADFVGTKTSFSAWNSMVGFLQGTGQTRQIGIDVMGHVDIPHSPFTIFGLWQYFEPNTKVDKNPLDFTRYDLGLQYMINKNLRVAFTAQSLSYFHDQFTFPGSELSKFAGKPEGDVPFAVARDTHAFFLNMEFKY